MLSECNNGLFNCITPLPMDASGKMSDYEFLCWVQANVTNLITSYKDLLEAYNELKAYIDSQLSDPSLIQKLQEIIYNMIKTGYFNNIGINVYNFSRVCRVMGDAYANYPNTSEEYLNAVGFMQGGTLVNDTSYLFAMVSTNSINDATWVEINIPQGTISRSVSLTTGHTSGMCYVNGNVYMVPYYYNTNKNEYISKMFIYDYLTLTQIDEIDTPVAFTGVTYDKVTNVFYCIGSGYIYTFDLTNQTFTLFSTYDDYVYGLQAMCANNGLFYWLYSSPACIITTDLNLNRLNLSPILPSYGIYRVGETENINIDSNGNLYIGTCVYNAYDRYRMNNLFVTNINYSNEEYIQTGGIYANINQFYLGENNSLNPDGTQSNPFPTLCDCLSSIYALTSQFKKVSTITYVNGDYSDETGFFEGLNIWINGGSYHQLIFNNCVRINLDNITVQTDNIATQFAPLDFRRSNAATIGTTTINGTSTPTYLIRGYETVLIFNGNVNLNANATTARIYTSDYAVCWSNTTRSYIDGDRFTSTDTLTESTPVTLTKEQYETLDRIRGIEFVFRFLNTSVYASCLIRLYELTTPSDFSVMLYWNGTPYFCTGTITISQTQITMTDVVISYYNNGVLTQSSDYTLQCVYMESVSE